MIETRVGLQAALNCDRTKTAHPATPTSVEELARNAAACVAACVAALMTARSTPLLRCDVA
jgi:uncharacterized protein (DUF849 family)